MEKSFVHRLSLAGLFILCFLSCAGQSDQESSPVPGISGFTSSATTSEIALAANISGNAEMISECGFLLGPTGSESSAFNAVRTGNSFSIKVREFLFATEYEAVAYISNGRNIIYSDVSKVMTPAAPKEEQTVDLSAGGTANCYVVSQSGLYKFQPTKGCSNAPLGNIAAVEVLWESLGTAVAPKIGQLVKEVDYVDGCVCFKVPETFAEGNAVVAAKDASGKILWSWHIWLTDQPKEQIYYRSAGTMMDRNLGATSSDAGSVGALGLLYQWGRKDPFRGASSIRSNTFVRTTISWPSSVTSDEATGTMAFSVANPTKYISRNSLNSDWFWTGTSKKDTTRWTSSNQQKSIYDPCPAGWRVPDGGKSGVWAKAAGKSTEFNDTYDQTAEGIDFSEFFGSATSIWYPAAGCLSSYDGALLDVGEAGYWLSATHGATGAYRLYFNDDGHVIPVNIGSAGGCSVRCTKE